ncbi:peptidoglycan-binding domain-containing protein [Streptomyces geranii]|uniref:peptidoglycan-binding domain-containing protein n=1 Tax=Streptomyces geranii TaxID=2058923 RepID=UPI001E43F6EF|nr:peptidoglycan-binding domain-containing protein [Streptomyces geranii]
MRRTLRAMTPLVLAASLVTAGSTAAFATSTATTPTKATTAPVTIQNEHGCPYSSSHPTLRRGSVGNAVRHLQCLLQYWGYPYVAVDGEFGPLTETAVRDFQAYWGVPGGADGVVGTNTWAYLHR